MASVRGLVKHQLLLALLSTFALVAGANQLTEVVDNATQSALRNQIAGKRRSARHSSRPRTARLHSIICPRLASSSLTPQPATRNRDRSRWISAQKSR